MAAPCGLAHKVQTRSKNTGNLKRFEGAVGSLWGQSRGRVEPTGRQGVDVHVVLPTSSPASLDPAVRRNDEDACYIGLQFAPWCMTRCFAGSIRCRPRFPSRCGRPPWSPSRARDDRQDGLDRHPVTDEANGAICSAVHFSVRRRQPSSVPADIARRNPTECHSSPPTRILSQPRTLVFGFRGKPPGTVSAWATKLVKWSSPFSVAELTRAPGIPRPIVSATDCMAAPISGHGLLAQRCSLTASRRSARNGIAPCTCAWC